jgi:hypothetical protein
MGKVYLKVIRRVGKEKGSVDGLDLWGLGEVSLPIFTRAVAPTFSQLSFIIHNTVLRCTVQISQIFLQLSPGKLSLSFSVQNL